MSDDITRGLRRGLESTYDEQRIRAKAMALIGTDAPDAAPGVVHVEPAGPSGAVYAPPSAPAQRVGWIWPTAAFGLATALLAVLILVRVGSGGGATSELDALARAAGDIPAAAPGDELTWSYAYTETRDEVLSRRDQTISSNGERTTVQTSRELPMVGETGYFVPEQATTEQLPPDAPAFAGFTADELRTLPESPTDLVNAVRDHNPAGDDAAAALTLMKIAAMPSLDPGVRSAAVRGLGVLGGTVDGRAQDPYDLSGAAVVGPDLTWMAIIDSENGAPVSFVTHPGTRDPLLNRGDWTFWRLDPIPEADPTPEP